MSYTGRDSGHVSVRAVVALVIIFFFAIFLFQNSAVVEIRFLFWKLSMSRVLMLAGSLGAGAVVGFILGWEAFGKKRG